MYPLLRLSAARCFLLGLRVFFFPRSLPPCIARYGGCHRRCVKHIPDLSPCIARYGRVRRLHGRPPCIARYGKAKGLSVKRPPLPLPVHPPLWKDHSFRASPQPLPVHRTL